MKSKKLLKNERVNNGGSHAIPRNLNLNSARKSWMIAAASVALSALALPASATNWWTQTPTLSIGSTVINVRNMGAMGNGVNDDTAAFQAAFNALPTSGGTVVVPNGTYMINALEGISMRSHSRLSMASAAVLSAIPNNAQRSWVVKVWNVNNVEIVGGHIVGERVGHTGTTGEWGYGIDLEGASTVSVHDIALSNCWGDGLVVSATGSGSTAVLSTGVTINRVTSTNNRRQGLTIGPSQQVYVVNSSFTDSNGIAPQAGIDIEPATQGSTSQVRIENSVLSNNVGNGLEMHANVSGVVLTTSTAENNQGYGVFDADADNVQITSNLLSENYLFGVDMASTTSNVQIDGNTITWNGDAWFYAHKESIFTEGWDLRDITIASTTSGISQANNTISPQL
jgi:polygalacturonase